MKLTNRIMGLTSLVAMSSTVVNAANTQLLSRGLGDWISLVAEVLSFVCLFVFITYIGRYLSVNKAGTPSADGENAKVMTGIKNGIMTGLVGIALCQATVIVAQIIFVK